MKFKLNIEQRVFVTILALSIVLSCLCIWVTYHFVVKRTEQDFLAKYQALSNIMSGALFELEQNTDTLMLNAAKVLQSRIKSPTNLSTEHLKSVASELNLTHIFIIDKNGNFIRSTNEGPNLIPNLFSFCDQYRTLISGQATVFKTPIIPPEPELNPYKFVMVPGSNRNFIIEVGIKAEFISRTLSRALLEDPNIVDLRLFAPNGTTLGSISRGTNRYERQVSDLSKLNFNTPIIEPSYISYFTKIPSSQTQCCQCDKAKLSLAGEYYYVLKTNVSRTALAASVRTITLFFLVLQTLFAIVSFFVARFISRHLVRDIQTLTAKVIEISDRKDLTARIPTLSSSSEVAELSKSFNGLLTTLEVYQDQILESKKGIAVGEIAKQVAHDIRSPLSALQILRASAEGMPSQWRSLLQKSCDRIQAIADDLTNRYQKQAPVLVVSVIRDIISEKELLFPQATFKLNFTNETYSYFSMVDRKLFERVLSNLINNSLEASGPNTKIELSVGRAGSYVEISIKDNGPGFDREILGKIGTQQVSTKGYGRGLGLHSAIKVLRSWGGNLNIENAPDVGAIVILSMPLDTELSASIGNEDLRDLFRNS